MIMMSKRLIFSVAFLAAFIFSSTAVAQTQPDSLSTVAERIRVNSPALRTNLAWAGTATPNLGVEFHVGQHFTLAVDGGYKPWPRWLAWDNDIENPLKWRHMAVESVLRWYPKENYRGFVLGSGLVWSHYNIASITAPWGLYPELATYRLQGDFYGLNLTLGWSWWLTRHLRLSLEAGAAAGYRKAARYDCPRCGAEVGTSEGYKTLPKLDVSVAYHLFSAKHSGK